jgi:(p)ppGpp synthase/HD superfamily hydrolase
LKLDAEYIRRFKKNTHEDEQYLDVIKMVISKLLSRKGMNGEVQGRVKNLVSARNKAYRTGKSLRMILDRIGLRIIVQTVPECYQVLDILHSYFQPIPNRFKDYIGLPKGNGYQSLHTCVYPMRSLSYKPIEFQIRTKSMHQEAEFGIASHWLYKRRRQSIARDALARISHEHCVNVGITI